MDDERASRLAPKTGAERKFSGRGAFRTAEKDIREGVWSVRKRKCRHE